MLHLFKKSTFRIVSDCERAALDVYERYCQALNTAQNEYAQQMAAIEMRRMDAALSIRVRQQQGRCWNYFTSRGF